MITELTISTGNRAELIDITGLVQDAVRDSDVSSGCASSLPHTTAGLTLNENWDPAVRDDAIRMLDELVPQSAAFRHAGELARPHQAMLLGFTATIPIESGALVMGTWRGVPRGVDGPRRQGDRQDLAD